MSRSIPALVTLALLAACGEKDGTTDDSAVTTDDSEVTTDDSGEVATEAPDSIAEVEETAPYNTDSGLIAEETIGEPGDRDFYGLEVEEGDFVQLRTIAYGLTGEVVCDTVLRLYDQDGNLLATNDDMPYRFQETDSALFFQAAYTGVYYVEVLEWSDWAENPDYPPTGGSTYRYELYGFPLDSLDVLPNDSLDDADALIDSGAILYYTTAMDEYVRLFLGDFDEGDQVDYWPLQFTSGGAHYMFSLWPTYMGEAELALSLYNPDGERVAYTESPEFSSTYYFLYDVGLMHPMSEGTWYVGVENLSGDTGPGNFYAGLYMGYTAEYGSEEVEPNDDTLDASRLSFTESTSTANYFYGRAHGNIPDFDDVDTYVVTASDVDSLAGRYLNAQVMAESVGSTGAFTLLVRDADDNLLGEASLHPDYGTGDPELRDILLPEGGSVSVQLVPDDLGDEPLANHYYLMLRVTDDPLYAE